MSVAIIATVVAKAHHIEAVKEALTTIVNPSRSEKGCLHYTLNRDPVNPERFYLFEQWQNNEVLEEHTARAHFQILLNALENKIELMDVQQLENIA